MVWSKLESWMITMPANTRRKYSATLKEFLDLYQIQKDAEGAELLCQANSENAYEYIEWCKSRPAQGGRSALVSDRVSLSTVRNKCLVLFSVFKHLQALGHVRSNPFELPKIQLRKVQGNDRRPHKMIPFEKVEELLSLNWSIWRDGERDRAFIAALFGGGLRRSEAIKLRILDIQRIGARRIQLLLRDTKRQKAERQFLPPWASDIIDSFAKKRKTEGANDNHPVFTKYVAGRPTNDFLDERTSLRLFKRAIKRVGLGDEYSCHCARVTSITNLVRAGVGIQDVSKWARHASISTTVRYHRFDEEDTAKVAEMLTYRSRKKLASS